MINPLKSEAVKALFVSVSRSAALSFSAIIVVMTAYLISMKLSNEFYILCCVVISIAYGAFVVWSVLSSNIDQTYKELIKKVSELDVHIHEYGKLLKWKGYGNTNYRPEDFEDVYKQILLDVTENIFAINYMSHQQWKDSKMDKMLFILKGKKEGGDHILAQRIFIFDRDEEIHSFREVIERNIECGVDVYFVKKSDLEDRKIVSGDITETFIVFDEKCVVFKLYNRKMTEFRTSVEEGEVEKLKRLFDRMRRVSKQYNNASSDQLLPI